MLGEEDKSKLIIDFISNQNLKFEVEDKSKLIINFISNQKFKKLQIFKKIYIKDKRISMHNFTLNSFNLPRAFFTLGYGA